MDTNGHSLGSVHAPGASKANGLYAAAAVPVAAPAPDARGQATGPVQLHLDAHHQQHGRTLWPAPHAASLGHGAYSSKPPGAAVGTATPLQQQQQPPHVMAETSATPLPTCHTGATTAAAGAAPAAAGADMASEAAAATPDITYHVRRMSHKQLMAAAAAYNLSAIGTQDPIADTLRGIEDVADLRPGTAPALAFTLGTVPADSPYFKAWKGVRRGLKPAAAGPAAPLAFKGSSGRSAMRTSQPAGSSDAAPTAAGGAPRSSQAVAKLTPEQQRWVDKLSAFLGRPVKVPRLAASLPVLDLRALWLEVISLGGLQAASHANAWPAIADKLQHDAGMASPLQAVYDCYLQPLEAELPSGIRPARALDFIEGRVQQRAAAAARLGSYSGVQHAAEQAAAAFQALEEQQRQQKQQQVLVDGASDVVQQAAAGSSAATSAAASSANAGADGAHAGTAEQQPKAATAAAAGPPLPAASQQQAGVSHRQLHPAVLLAAALLQEAALFPADVVQSVRGWGLQPSFCPDRLEACKRAHSTARAARRRSGRDSGRGAHSSDSDEAGSSSREAPHPGSSSSRSGSEAQGAPGALSDSDDEPAQDAPSRAGSGVADRTGDYHEQPSAGGAEREQLQQARQAQPSVLSDSDDEEVIVLGSGPSSSHGQDSEGAAAGMTAENGTGTKRARSVDSSGADDRHGQQGEQQQRQQPGQKEEQIEQHKSARQSSTSPGSKRRRFQTIPLARSASEALAEGVGTMQACNAPPVLPDSQQQQEAARAQQQQQQQQQQQSPPPQAAVVLGATQLQLMEGPVATGAGDAAGQLAAEDAGNQAGHSDQQPASSTSTAATGAAPGNLREGSVPAVTAAAVANQTRLRSAKGLPAGGAVGNVLPEEALTWHAARWLLLVRRALGAGPPGCEKRQIVVPPGDRRPKDVPGGVAESGRAQQRRPPLFGEVEARAGGKRTYKGVTPKCGSCHTCKHPSMKKACITNRDRLAQGLPPILPNS